MYQTGSRRFELGLGIWQKQPYPELVELIRLAEDAGYDVLWIGNEKFYRDMWVTLGLVAAHVKRATIGTFVAEPYTYHPALMAAAIATVDEAVNGRSIFLLGAGAVGLKAMGIERVRPVAAVEETMRVVRRLLNGERVSHQGQAFELSDAHLDFAARADLPIWVASRGNRMLQMAGRTADGVMIATYATPAGVRCALDRVAAGRAEAGRDMNDYPVTVRVDVCLDDDAGAARAAVKPMIAGMIKASYPNRDFIEQVGLELPPAFYDDLLKQPFGHMDGIVDRLPETFVDAFAWAGTPAQIAEKVAAMVDMGIDRITFLPHTSAATASVGRMVRRFADEVVPRVMALM